MLSPAISSFGGFCHVAWPWLASCCIRRWLLETGKWVREEVLVLSRCLLGKMMSGTMECALLPLWLMMRSDLESSGRFWWSGTATSVWQSTLLNSSSFWCAASAHLLPLWKILLTNNRHKASASEHDQERAVGFRVLLSYALWNGAEWSLALFFPWTPGLPGNICCLPFVELSSSLTSLEFDSVCFSFKGPIPLHDIQLLWLTLLRNAW